MNELVFTRNDQVVTSSRNVARDFGKGHREVLRAIDNIINSGAVQDCTTLFYETTYVHEQNKQEYRQYLMNRDGFTLLVMGFEGREAMQFKMKYINAFNEMEKELKQPKSIEDLIILQAQSMKDVKQRLSEIEKTQEGYKKVISINNKNWRDDVNRILNTIARKNGGIYKQIRKESYSRLESRGRCDLERRLDNKIERLVQEGATKTKINNTNKLDIINDDPKLLEIYLAIVKEMAIEHGVEKELAWWKA